MSAYQRTTTASRREAKRVVYTFVSKTIMVKRGIVAETDKTSAKRALMKSGASRRQAKKITKRYTKKEGIADKILRELEFVS